MKKLLALVLALVMSLSLVTISSADFKDADKIDYNEAVDVMNAVGVFIGDDNGNFNPKANLERAQAAKIVAYLLLGNKTAEGLAGSGKFTDVAKTNWAAGFIDYCAATGVVAGVGNGKFDPNGSLTTLQFAKMLLVALGYDAKIEGFTGNDWSINVSAKANQVGLLDGLDVGANAALTREQAAKMALNTLKSPLVEYDTKGTTVTVGSDAHVTVGASKAEFKTSTNKKAQTISNDVINGTTAYTVEFAEEYYSDLKLNSDTTDDFGRPCVEWFWKADSIGVYSNSDDLVATYTAEVTAADVYTAVGKSVSDDVNNAKSKATLVSYIDGVKTEVAKANVYQYVTKNDTTTVNDTGNGDYTEVYVDDDNNVTIVTIRTYLFQAASDYNVKKDTITLTAAGDTMITLDNIVVDGEDFNIKDFKSDDYVLVTASKDKNSNKYTVQSVDAAEVVSGEVTGYKLDNNVTLGGTTYKYSSTTKKSTYTESTKIDKVRGTTYTVGQTARVVLDKYGYVIAVDEAIVSSNYVYVSEFAQPSGLSTGKVVASAYFTDGTTADITVKEALGKTNKAAIKASAAGWYTYSKNSSNEYTLYNVEGKFQPNYATQDYDYAVGDRQIMKNDKVNFLAKPTDPTATLSVYANNETIVIVDDGSDVSLYTGVKNIPDIVLKASGDKAHVTLLQNKNNNYAYYVFVSTEGKPMIAGNEDSKLVYYVKYDGQFKTTDNKMYYTYKVLDENGKEEIVKFDSKYIAGTDIYAVYNKTRVDSDNYITQVSPVAQAVGTKYISGATVGTGVALTYTDGALALTGGNYTLADNAKITLVTLKSANELNKNKAADYEAAVNLSGKALGDLLKDYSLEYNYAGKVTDTDGTVISELFVTVTKATFTKGGVNNGGGNDLKPGEKPVSALKDGVIYQRSINGDTVAAQNDVVAVLGAAGYSRVTDKGTYYEAYDKNGNVAYFSLVEENYWTLTVDKTVVEYVLNAAPAKNSTTTWKTVLKDAKGTYVKQTVGNGAATEVAISGLTDTDPVVSSMNNYVVIETGYVKVVNSITGTATITDGSNNVDATGTAYAKGDKTKTSVLNGHVKVDELVVNAAYGNSASINADVKFKVWVELTVDGKVIKSDAKEVTGKDLNDGDVDVTVEFAGLTKDVTKIELKSEKVIEPVALKSSALRKDAKGLTFTWNVPTTVTPGAVSVVGKLTITGQITDRSSNIVVELDGTMTTGWKWADTKDTKLVVDSATPNLAKLTIDKDWVNSGETTLTFVFDVDAGADSTTELKTKP